MSEKEIIKKIFSNQWVHVGLWKDAIFRNSGWVAPIWSQCWKDLEFAEKLQGDMIILAGHNFINRHDFLLFEKIILGSLRGKNDWLDLFFKICERETAKTLKLENKKSLTDFFGQMAETIAVGWLICLVGIVLNDYLEKECKKYNFSFAEFMSLIVPSRKTMLLKYYEDLGKTKGSNLKEFVAENKWLGYSSLTSRGLTVKIAQEELAKLKKEKKKEVRGRCPASLLPLLKMSNKLAFYRTYCKEVILKTGFSYLGLIKKFGAGHKLDLAEMENLSIFEMIELSRGGKLPELKGRCEDSGIGVVGGQWFVISPRKTAEVLKTIKPRESGKKLTVVKGTPASLGKVIGKVKVVFSVKDLDKVKEGDIMVATETIPEFLSAMRRAAAFVTDQGGITCHAAIVSRELGVPCVIGTKIGTEVLRDGMLVEVDADKGIVKILS